MEMGINLTYIGGHWYEDQPGMMRDIANGRPYRFIRATIKTMFELFDPQK